MISAMPDAMQITVRLGEPLRRAAGQFRLALALPAGATVAALVETLRRTYPEFGHRYAGRDLGHDHPYAIFVNSVQVERDDYERRSLHDGDVVHIVVPVVGGMAAVS